MGQPESRPTTVPEIFGGSPAARRPPVHAVDLVIVERSRYWGGVCERRYGERAAGGGTVGRGADAWWEDARTPCRPVVKLWETRSMQSAAEQLVRAPWALVGLQCDLLAWPLLASQLFHWQRVFPHVAVVLLGRAPVCEVEWELRSAGAIAAVHGVLELPWLDRLLVRQWQRVPPPEQTWYEQIEERLPWKRFQQRPLRGSS